MPPTHSIPPRQVNTLREKFLCHAHDLEQTQRALFVTTGADTARSDDLFDCIRYWIKSFRMPLTSTLRSNRNDFWWCQLFHDTQARDEAMEWLSHQQFYYLGREIPVLLGGAAAHVRRMPSAATLSQSTNVPLNSQHMRNDGQGPNSSSNSLVRDLVPQPVVIPTAPVVSSRPASGPVMYSSKVSSNEDLSNRSIDNKRSSDKLTVRTRSPSAIHSLVGSKADTNHAHTTKANVSKRKPSFHEEDTRDTQAESPMCQGDAKKRKTVASEETLPRAPEHAEPRGARATEPTATNRKRFRLEDGIQGAQKESPSCRSDTKNRKTSAGGKSLPHGTEQSEPLIQIQAPRLKSLKARLWLPPLPSGKPCVEHDIIKAIRVAESLDVTPKVDLGLKAVQRQDDGFVVTFSSIESARKAKGRTLTVFGEIITFAIYKGVPSSVYLLRGCGEKNMDEVIAALKKVYSEPESFALFNVVSMRITIGGVYFVKFKTPPALRYKIWFGEEGHVGGRWKVLMEAVDDTICQYCQHVHKDAVCADSRNRWSRAAGVWHNPNAAV